MTVLKTAKRWANRWSRYFTDATNSKISFYLVPRGYGLAHFALERLKKPRMLKALKKLALSKYIHKLKCSRKKIKRRGVK